MTEILKNKNTAGYKLALKLGKYANRSDVLVLALPRGGVPVGFEIAKKLNVSLDICLVRKLGVPRHKELAMGAIATGEVITLNQDIIEELNITAEEIQAVIAEEKIELARREKAYGGNRPLPQIRDKTIILVDDGIATGATIRAALATLKQKQPASIIVAVPIVQEAICEALKAEVDEVICLHQPAKLRSISLWYEDFAQTSDEEVRHLLAKTSN